jgi:hypothetical protein
VEARPWGGSQETEQFQRKVRQNLRKLKREMHELTAELEEEIRALRDEFLKEADNVEPEGSGVVQTQADLISDPEDPDVSVVQET